MDVKPGYKQTEVGVIPENWEVASLSTLCRSICDGTHFTPHYVAQGIPFYSVENVTANEFSDTKFISEAEHALLVRRCKPERGDILMTRIGSLGDTKLLDWDVNASIYVSLALLKPNERVHPNYLYRYTRSKAFVLDVEKRSLLNATPKKINMGDIGAIPIPFPRSVLEQEAIAEALSDADAYIESLEQLIAKKRQIKQGAMQELLTGKRRLPGFDGEWKTRTYGESFEFLQTANNSRSELAENGEIAYLHYGDIHTHPTAFLDFASQVHTFIPKAKVYTIPRLADGDLVLVDASEDTTAIGKAIEVRGLNAREAIAGLHTMLLRARKDVLADGFKGYLQYLPSVRAALVRLATGVSVYGITKTGVKSIEIMIPEPAEQMAIAAILSEMDIEIAALEEKLAKARQIKQGMMQELLIGRIRLV